jgi:hypothetical protein
MTCINLSFTVSISCDSTSVRRQGCAALHPRNNLKPPEVKIRHRNADDHPLPPLARPLPVRLLCIRMIIGVCRSGLSIRAALSFLELESRLVRFGQPDIAQHDHAASRAVEIEADTSQVS